MDKGKKSYLRHDQLGRPEKRVGMSLYEWSVKARTSRQN